MHTAEYEAMFRLEDFYWWYVARRRLMEDLVVRESQAPEGGRERRILDVGCGTGSNLAVLSRHGHAVGVDLAAEAAEFCKQRGLTSVALSELESLPFADGSFDIVIAMDVLEHLDDDLKGLAALRRVLRPGGLLLVTVPAYGFLWSEHDEALKHRRRYTAHELRNKMTIVDLKVARSSYFITALFFPILALRIHQGLFKKSAYPQTSIRVLPAWINSVLIGVLHVERWVHRIVNLPFGVSVVLTAQKPEIQQFDKPPVRISSGVAGDKLPARTHSESRAGRSG